MTRSLLVGFDYNPEKDSAVLIISEQLKNDSIKIINAFEGEEAKALYEKLITKKEKEKENA